jgi:mannose-6-phosphate isomerase-like protein (cupin superfamily)
MPRIETKDAQGRPNGWLLPIWHKDDGPRVDQVYLTAVAPGSRKGPHLHLKRSGLFACIRGTAMLVIRVNNKCYVEVHLHPGGRSAAVCPGEAAAIYNTGTEEAWLLNMPSPPWRADDQDEHPVEDWTYELETVSF